MWEYEEDGLPSIGKSIRVLSGSAFEIDYLPPFENEESFIFFVAAENIDVSYFFEVFINCLYLPA
jgi:hypothetical protein